MSSEYNAIIEARDVVQWSLNRFNEINKRIYEIRERFIEIHPVMEGAVWPDLNSCGKDCLGCPHIRWIKWVKNQKINPQKKWLAVRIEGNPRNYFLSKNQHKLTIKERLMLMKELSDLIKDREMLIKYISGLKKQKTLYSNRSQKHVSETK